MGLVLAATLLGSGGLTASAQTPDKDKAADFKALLDCKALTDPAERLACYDKATDTLQAAEAKGDVVVIDRGQVRQARRAAFGFNFQMPSFMTKGEKPEELTRLEATVASFRYNQDGKLVVKFDDGATWVQIDSNRLRKGPAAGTKVELRTASMGSYFMKIPGLDTIRVRREN